MSNMADLTIYIAVDHEGNTAVGSDASEAMEAYRNEVTDTPDGAVHVVSLVVHVPIPPMPKYSVSLDDDDKLLED